MSRAPATDDLPESLELLVHQFDQAWRSGSIPSIQAFLAQAAVPADTARAGLLHELIKLDLEYRWRHSGPGSATPAPGDCFCLEHYVARFSELGRWEKLPLDLIGWEYRVRHCWGDRPNQAAYRERFAAHGPALAETL